MQIRMSYKVYGEDRLEPGQINSFPVAVLSTCGCRQCRSLTRPVWMKSRKVCLGKSAARR
ncbi:hypothetical protein ACP4OV_006580 [Aristida adscensionis]